MLAGWPAMLLGFICLELISYAAFPHLWLSRIAFALIVAAAAYLTAKKIEYGAYLLLAELAVGGFGYLISFPIAGGRISMRLGLFGAVILVWLVKSFRQGDYGWIRDRRLIPLASFFAVAAIAVANGFLSGRPAGQIFSDFNGYLYFAAIGLFLAVGLKPAKSLQIILAGSFVLGVKTLAVLYIFSHGYAVVGPSLAYHWIRDTGIGEISLINAPLYRIFFQSHFYNLLALISAAFILLVGPKEDGNSILNIISRSRIAKALLWFIAWFNFFILVVSQSRSFWVAGLATLVFVLPAAAMHYRISFKRIAAYLLMIPAFAIISNFAGQAVVGNYSIDFFSGRVNHADKQAGVSSRMAELAPAFQLIGQAPLLGHGFGATVRFRSDDPRIKNESNPEGWTDAVNIEWGYLDLAVKAGLLGLAAYLSFLLCLAWSLFASALKENKLAASLFIGLAALMIVHMFTPYLNHPLGIGYILLIFGLMKKFDCKPIC